MRTALRLLLLLALPAVARASSYPPPVRERQVIVPAAATGVPTSARPRIAYVVGAYAQAACADPPPAPVIRLAPRAASPDGGARDAAVAEDAGTVLDGGLAGQWVRATDQDPRVATVWEFRPSPALAADTDYELVDTSPAQCMCEGALVGCRRAPAAVFARFRTAAGPDVTRPKFSGLAGAYCAYAFCTAKDSGCCGPYEHFDYVFVDQNNALDEHLVGVHYYVRREGGKYDFSRPVGAGRVSDPVDAFDAWQWSYSFQPGKHFVIARAFDSSGNEDDNLVEVPLVFPFKDDPQCKAPVVRDLAVLRDAAVPVDAAPAGDLATSPPPKPAGACSLGGQRAGAPPLLALLLALILRRGSRRSGRAGPAGSA